MPEVIVINPIKNNEIQKKRVCAYARVSSDSADQLNSFDAQVEYYTSLISNNPDYELIDIYADEGISGTSKDKRDEFLRMINDCRKRKIDIIITKSVSRFARNTLESLETVRELRGYGVTVKFENDNFNTESMTDELLLTVLSTKAQEESLSISGNIRWGYQKQMQSGKYITASPPFGYRLVNKTLVINECEAETVKYIFNSYLAGKGTWLIANELTKGGIAKKSGVTKWYDTTVTRMLKNEKYIGDSLLQKKYTTDTLPFRRKINTGQKDQYYIKNTHPAIISHEDFDRVQELLKTSSAKHFNRKKISPSYPLRKKVICGECGLTFARTVLKNISYWICNKHNKNSSDCSMQPIVETKIYEGFIRLYNKLKRNYDKILIPLITELKDIKARINSGNTQISEINSRLAELANQNLVLKDVESKGYLDSDIFMRQSNEIKAKMTKLRHEKQLLMQDDEDDETIELTETIIEIIENGDDYITEFSSELFAGLVSSVIIDSKTQAQFQLKNGLKLTENI